MRLFAMVYHGFTPLENFDYSDFLKISLSGLKNVLSYPEDQKTIFSGLICPNDTYEKTFYFFTKTMD